MNLFVYGTLLDDDLFAAVLGTARFEYADGKLNGWRRTGLVGQTYPVLIEDQNAATHGRIVYGLDEAQMDRVQFYECLDYGRLAVDVDTASGRAQAFIFVPTERVASDNQAWDLARWQKQEKRFILPVTRQVMPLYGVESLDTIDAIWDRLEAEERAKV